MDFYKVPIGFGMALAQNEAAMLRYAQLSEGQTEGSRLPCVKGAVILPILGNMTEGL